MAVVGVPKVTVPPDRWIISILFRPYSLARDLSIPGERKRTKMIHLPGGTITLGTPTTAIDELMLRFGSLATTIYRSPRVASFAAVVGAAGRSIYVLPIGIAIRPSVREIMWGFAVQSLGNKAGTLRPLRASVRPRILNALRRV